MSCLKSGLSRVRDVQSQSHNNLLAHCQCNGQVHMPFDVGIRTTRASLGQIAHFI